MLRNITETPIERIAILIAMQGEANPIIDKLKMQEDDPQKYGFHPLLGIKIYSTTRQEKAIFLVVNGQDAINKVERVGTQAAAITAFTVIEKLKPDTIINAGTAGGLKDSQIGDVFVSGGPLVYHDRRITFGNYPAYGRGSFDYVDLPIAASALGLKPGIVSSGSSLDASADDIRLLKEFNADVVDMEAAAIAEIAARLGVRMIALKSITNFIDKNLHSDFEKNYSLAVGNLAEKAAALIPFILNKTPSQLCFPASRLTPESIVETTDKNLLAEIVRQHSNKMFKNISAMEKEYCEISTQLDSLLKAELAPREKLITMLRVIYSSSAPNVQKSLLDVIDILKNQACRSPLAEAKTK
jgi:5'-methylthioadenosine nucleosidase